MFPLVLLLLLLQLLLVLLVLLREPLLILSFSLRRRLLLRWIQTIGQEMQDVVIVRKASRRRRNPEITIFGQRDVLHTEAHLVVLLVASHAVVEEQSERVLVVLDASLGREWFVAEVAQAARCELGRAIAGRLGGWRVNQWRNG